MKYGKEILRMIEVYINGDMESKLEEMGEWIEGKGSGVKTIIGRDFNARTGREGKRINGEG